MADDLNLSDLEGEHEFLGILRVTDVPKGVSGVRAGVIKNGRRASRMLSHKLRHIAHVILHDYPNRLGFHMPFHFIYSEFPERHLTRLFLKL